MESESRNSTISCEICGSRSVTLFNASEKMYGLGGNFTYAKCMDCGTIYQHERLADYSEYYPQNYYSFGLKKLDDRSLKQSIRAFKKRSRDRFYFFKTGIIGRLLTAFRSESETHVSRHINFDRNMFILDAGCGAGEYIYDMAEIGFKHVFGLDPFVSQSREYKNGAKIYRGDLEQFSRENPYLVDGFDLIIFNHSFEHSTQPLNELLHAKKLLKPGGRILVRIPVSASYAADTYGTDWVQLDAPRHIYLFNEKSMAILAHKVGLKIEKVFYDSSDAQFWGSEQYKAGIPLLSENSYAKSRKRSIFSRAQIRRYKKETRRLNELGLGDQAGFILTATAH